MSMFVEILRWILCCCNENRHDREFENWERDPLHVRSFPSSSGRNSSCSNDDFHYYKYDPNVPISSLAPRKPSSVSQISDASNKSLMGTRAVSESLKSSKPSLPSSSYYTCSSPSRSSSSPKPPSLASDRNQSSAKPPSSLGNSSQLPSVLTAPSLKSLPSSKPTLSPLTFHYQKATSPDYTTSNKNESLMKIDSMPKVLKLPLPQLCEEAPSSSKPILSLLPSDSSYQQKFANYIRVQKGTSNYKIPKDIEDVIKEDIVPSVSKKPLPPLHQEAPSSSKPILSPLPSDSTYQQKDASFIWVQKGTSNYKIPKDIEDLIKEDIVPNVLKKPLSPSTYKDYFAALLYAEDFYHEKWSGFQLLNVTLALREAAIYDKSLKKEQLNKSDKKKVKFFVAFEIDSVPMRRPFLLSRDFVFAQRANEKSKKFQGLLYRVVKSTTVLVEFGKEFYSQHRPNVKYDISFSFNRVSLKRAHQAIAAVSAPLLQTYLFPGCTSRKTIFSPVAYFDANFKLDSDSKSAVQQILSFQGQSPFLIEGPLCVTRQIQESDDETVAEFVLSKTGIIVRKAVLGICCGSATSRVLICAPSNRTCDVLMESLMGGIPESDMFRANAAFREMDELSDDILQLSLLEGECFSCPSLEELRQHRVISSTFVSSFRLHNQGITAGHFTHIFLVDASSAIEPDIVIVLSKLAKGNTRVIVTGTPRDNLRWVRSDIARIYGLKMSYFERLRQETQNIQELQSHVL